MLINRNNMINDISGKSTMCLPLLCLLDTNKNDDLVKSSDKDKKILSKYVSLQNANLFVSW